MTHHYSLRSRGPVPSYSEAINRNLIELTMNLDDKTDSRNENQREQGHVDGSAGTEIQSQNEESQTVACQTDSNEDSLNANQTQNGSNRQNINRGITQSEERSSQTDGASHRDSSLINENESPSWQYINNARNASAQLFKELEELRTKNTENEAIIKTLKQKLNINEVTMHKMNGQMTKLVTESQQRAIPKLPNFSGGPDDNIEVWITQFYESLHFLSDVDKLQEMLPKFRDIASDFVFGQLSYAERSDYQSLLSQLELRFKTVETPRMFQMHFDKRKQTVGESYHDFACDLKRLYGKAYPRRPWYVRNEDLVQKFLSCIMDQEAGAQVEYHKCPKTIDHAVYEMIRYTEVVGRSQSTNRAIDADLN